MSIRNRKRTLLAAGLIAAGLLVAPSGAWAGSSSGPAPGIPVPGSDDVLVEKAPSITGLVFFDAVGLSGATVTVFQGNCGKYAAFGFETGFPPPAPEDTVTNPNPLGHYDDVLMQQVITGPDDLEGRAISLPFSKDGGLPTVVNHCDADTTDDYEFAVIEKVKDFQLVLPNVFLAELSLRPLVVWKPTSP